MAEDERDEPAAEGADRPEDPHHGGVLVEVVKDEHGENDDEQA
jgi:hypothetical protein